MRTIGEDNKARERGSALEPASSVPTWRSPMDRESLRSVQQPLKERYRSEPEAALVTLHAEGTLGEGVTCSVQTGRALVEAGLHPASGGGGMWACSGDMLLPAPGGRAGVDTNFVRAAIAVPI